MDFPTWLGRPRPHGDHETVTKYDVAVAVAKTIQLKGRRMFLLDIDTGDWLEISE